MNARHLFGEDEAELGAALPRVLRRYDFEGEIPARSGVGREVLFEEELLGVNSIQSQNSPENCPQKCHELSNSINSYFLDFLVTIFEGFSGTFFGDIFWDSFQDCIESRPRYPVRRNCFRNILSIPASWKI